MFQSLEKLRLSTRLMIIVLLFAAPISGLALWLLAKGINGHIAFARQEIRGDTVQRPLENLLQAAGRAHARATGATNEDSAALNTAIATAFADLEAALAIDGVALQVTPAGLAARHRENFAVAAIESAWQTAGPTPSAAATAALMTNARGLIAHIGDTSNLILDPDLDSYYLMDVTLCVLPEQQERVATALGRFAPALRGGPLDAATRQAAGIQASLLRETNVARVDGDIQTALNEDPNFYGTSPTLATQLPAAQAEWHRAIDAFIAQLDGAAAGDASVTAATFTTSGQAAHAASFSFWHTTAEELDHLLARRIGSDESERRVSFLSLAALLAVASALTWRIMRGLNRQFRGLCANLKQNSRQLDHLAHAVYESSSGLADSASNQAASLE